MTATVTANTPSQVDPDTPEWGQIKRSQHRQVGPDQVITLKHQFQIRSESARVLQMSTPAQFERFVAALGRPTDEPLLPVPEAVDPAHVAEVCAQFSIEVLGPPPPPLDS